jgi:fibronectin type 3 domain-containing protein
VRSAFLTFIGLLCLAPGGPAHAQEVVKPRVSITSGRLPVPTNISATQRADGSIRLAWSPVEGAVRYTVSRSVPPAPVGPVTLPNAGDTVYIDRDVKAGNTYYYLVGAVDEAGIVGLKGGPPPVTAASISQAPSPPASVRVMLVGSKATVSWNFTQGLRYTVFRETIGGAGQPKVQVSGKLDRCCGFTEDMMNVAPGTRLVYHVLAENSQGMQSALAASNEVTVMAAAVADTTRQADTTRATDTTTTQPRTAVTNVHAAVLAEPARLKLGDPALKLGGSFTFTSLKLSKAHWVSLEEAVATVDAQGQVRARAVGTTYIIVNGMAPDGSVASMVTRIDVARR